MQGLGNDRWRVKFPVDKLGTYWYRIVGWVDRFHTWRHDLKKRADAGQDLHVALLIGAELVEAAADRAAAEESERLREFEVQIAGRKGPGSGVNRTAAPPRWTMRCSC